MSPSDAGRRNSRTRAYLWPRARARAHSLALLGRSPAVGHPVRARANFSARERAQVRGFCGTREHPPRALPPGPFGAAPDLRVGQMWKRFSFPCSPRLPSLLWLLEFEEERSRGRRGWVCWGKLARRPCSSPVLTLARWPPRSRRPARTVRSLHRFALLLPLEWTLSPTMSSQACSSPRAFLIPPPSLFPLTVSRQSPLLIHVIPWASFPFLNTGTPQPSWPTSCPLECSLRLDQALVFLDSPFLPEFVGLLPYLPPSPHARITLNGPCCSHWYPCTIWFGGAQGKHPAGSRTSADLPIQYLFLLCPASCPLMAQLAVYLSLLSPLLLQDEPHCLPMRGGEENGLQLSLVWAALSKMALAYFCNISILQREGPKEALRQRRQGS